MKSPLPTFVTPLAVLGGIGLLWFGSITLLKAQLISPESLIVMTTLLILAGKVNQARRRHQTDSRGDQSP